MQLKNYTAGISFAASSCNVNMLLSYVRIYDLPSTLVIVPTALLCQQAHVLTAVAEGHNFQRLQSTSCYKINRLIPLINLMTGLNEFFFGLTYTFKQKIVEASILATQN